MTDVVAVARRLAERLAAGATLLVHGSGHLAPDARHVVVEFVHPVIVGKSAYPALCVIEPRDAEVLGRPGDVALALGHAPEFLASAHRSGAETLVLDGDDGALVTSYHLLWEITQMMLESGERTADSDLAFLYGGADPDLVRADAERSLVGKQAESATLCAAVLDRYRDDLVRCGAEIGARLGSCGRVLTFGNGGSSTDASALALRLRATGTPAVCLADEPAILTALANDVGVEHVFARQVDALAGPHDVAVGLSTSGGSRNMLAAFDRARRAGLLTVGFAGYDGGAMATAGTVDRLFVVDSDSVHRIQEAQAALYTALADRVAR